MIQPQFHHCDCKMCEWLYFGTFFKFPCIVWIYAWFFIHCRNHHSGSHVNHVIILPHCEGNTLVSKVELWWFLHCYPEQTIELTMIWDAMILMLHHDNGMCRAQFQKRSDHCEKVIGSLISRSDRIPRTILLPSDHDPGDPARYMDRCWIRNFITTINHILVISP